jgi:hypothetical protein
MPPSGGRSSKSPEQLDLTETATQPHDFRHLKIMAPGILPNPPSSISFFSSEESNVLARTRAKTAVGFRAFETNTPSKEKGTFYAVMGVSER